MIIQSEFIATFYHLSEQTCPLLKRDYGLYLRVDDELLKRSYGIAILYQPFANSHSRFDQSTRYFQLRESCVGTAFVARGWQ
jgi:hypothetical protein